MTGTGAAERSRAPGYTLAVLMGLPAVAVAVASRHGLGLSPDSVFYVSAARSFASAGQLTDLSGTPLTLFPPGLPILLGVAQWVGIDATVAARLLNIACAALTVLLSYLLAREVLRSRRWALAVAALIAVAASTVQIYSMLWTEPAYVVLALTALLVLTRAVKAQRMTGRDVLLVAGAVCAATTLRFTGATLLPVVAVGALLAERQRGWRRASLVAAAATGSAALGLLAVAGRNVALGAPALGERFGSGTTLADIAADTLSTLGGYLYPIGQPFPAPPAWVPIVIGTLIAALAAYAAVRAVRTAESATVVLAVYLAVYLAFLVYGHLRATVDPVDFRLLAPVSTAGLILVADACSRVRLRNVAVPLLAGLLAASSLANLTQQVRAAARSTAADVARYNSPAMRDSPLGAALARLPAGGVAATDPVRAYWISGREPAVQIPRRDYYWPPTRTAADLETLRDAARSGRVAYAAFFILDATALTPSEVRDAGITLRPVQSFPDGTLWAVEHP